MLNDLVVVRVVGAAATVVVRFRRLRGAERQQMKWFVYAAALLPLAPVADALPEIVSNMLFGAV